jgi:hypothetical protein
MVAMGNRKRFTKSTTWILTLIGILAVVLLAPESSYAQGPSSFSLQFNTLPSAQGWTYFQGDGIPETSVFSVTGTSLIQDTIGIGEHGPNYAMFGVVDGSEPFQLTVRARVLAYEGTQPFGFFFDVRTAAPNQEYAIGFTPASVIDPLGNGIAIDTTVFHTYVLRATPGGPYTLDIDGHFAFGGPFSATGGALDAVQFGDGANLGPTNAQAEVTELEFSQGAAATVTGVSPGSGLISGGTSVTITGSGFTGATAVNFGGTAASSFTVNSDTSITATAPAATAVGPVDVTVTTPSGTSATSSADQYTYTYPFTGYQAPVDNPPTVNQVNRGQAIPMQFSLGGNYGLNIIAPGYPTATQISCTTGAPVNTGTLTDTAGGSGLQFDSATGTYTYVWKTSKSWAGTCQQFDLRLNDGTDHTANFQFK